MTREEAKKKLHEKFIRPYTFGWYLLLIVAVSLKEN